MDKGLTLLAASYADSIHYWQDRFNNGLADSGLNLETASATLEKLWGEVAAINTRLGNHIGFGATVEDMLAERQL